VTRTATLLAAVAATALLAAAPSGARAPADTDTLMRVASGVTRLKIQRPLTVARPTAAAARGRRAGLERRLRPEAARAHDAALFHALGLAPSVAAARRALQPAARATPFFDPRDGSLVLARGSSPSRSDILREVTSALQHQHFGLDRVLRRAGDRDALAAARAASDGYSRLVADLLTPPAPAAAGEGRLGRFLRLEEGFYATRAVRFAAELRNLGSNRAVWTALRAFPASTEQVFHVHKFLQREAPLPVALPAEAGGLRLASQDTFGELHVRALLATAGVARFDRAATGWGGGRSAVYRGPEGAAGVLALVWDRDVDAAEFEVAGRAALSRLAPGRGALVRQGRRTALAVVAAESGLAERLAAAVVSTSP
jgi:hypothetical protein